MLILNSSNLDLCNQASWNQELLQYQDATIHTTHQFGAVDLLLLGAKPTDLYFVDILKDDLKISKALVRVQRISAFYSNILIKKGLRLIAPLFRQVTWSHAPLISQQGDSVKTLDYFLSWVDRLALQVGAFAVDSVTPPFYYSGPEDVFSNVYNKYGYSRSLMATVKLALDGYKTIEDCWRNISKDARTKVKRALNDGIKITEDIKFDFLDEFIRLQKSSGYANLPFYRDVQLFRRISSIYDSGNMCKLFIASKDDQVLAGQTLFVFNNIIILEGVVISEVARKNKWYANDLMQWHIIEWAKENGLRIIDWGGFSLFPTEKEERINDFKLKWGGSIHNYYAYSKAFIPWKYGLYKGLKLAKKISSISSGKKRQTSQ